ncbi:hypothetical protein KSP39_PZI006388 [Platanthera zijinensis]|uniref:U3 small nucleolar RNA-associated protein 14 n=1 Tax=Platanthera zijinensis TaxID=2320716 RepID=A0AAP0G9R8_9ASPA
MEKHGRTKAHRVSKTPNFRRSVTKKKKSMKERKDGRREKSGPHLPSSFLKEIGIQNPISNSSDQVEGDDESDSDDLYEYEEKLPEEERKENRRFDQVENYGYELPEEFEDEDVPSNEEDHGEDDEEEKGDDVEKHARMLQSITGLPAKAFEDKPWKDAVLLDVHGDFGQEKISINDLLDPLHGKAGYSKLRKRLHQLEKAPMAIQAPLPKVEKEKLERKVAYEQSKKHITKWEPLVKRNREAPTLFFGEKIDLGVNTVGAFAAGHEPRTEFEKKMAELIGVPEIGEAQKNDGFKILELNKVSIEDVRDRQNYLAKMRSLLFRHEMKAKHIKNIKSKTYHRILKKQRQKTASTEINVDPEEAKELAIKQEFKRAEERMTLKHKNSSKWAKQILKRGLKAQDDGTRTAIADQLQEFGDIVKNPGSKTTYDVAIFASDSWRNVKLKGDEYNSDSESELEMVDGFFIF